MRSMSLNCPGCSALYEAHVPAGDYAALFCRLCGSLLTENVGRVEEAAELVDEDGPPQAELVLVQGPIRELRVWLDDDVVDRRGPEGWVHVTTSADVIRLLDSGRVVELSLDHDLGNDQEAGRGIDVIDYLAEQQEVHGRRLWPRDGITLHTANPYGRDAMARAIHNYAGRTLAVEESVTPGGKRRLRFSPRA